MTLRFSLISDTAGWTSAIGTLGGADFHHSHHFHLISQNNGEGEPLLLLVRSGDKLICAWPFLKREIPDSDAFDLGCCYGYPGPLFAAGINQLGTVNRAVDFLRQQGFVSLFSRLHPVNNAPLIDGPSDVLGLQKLGPIVAADLSLPEEQLLSEIRSTFRRKLRKLDSAGAKIRISGSTSDTAAFQEIYIPTMRRVGAANYYYFSDAYLDGFLLDDSFDAEYSFVEVNGSVAAAALYVQTATFTQYYLGGSNPDFYKQSPVLLAHTDMMLRSKRAGRRWFVPGGGLGGQEDPRFHFKLGIAKHTFTAAVLKIILNSDRYRALAGPDSGNTEGYFPAYRKP